MKSAHFALGAGVLLVGAKLFSTVRELPWQRGTAAVVWLAAAGLLAALVLLTVRTARRLSTAPVEDSQRAVYSLGLLALMLITLALAVPDLLGR